MKILFCTNKFQEVSNGPAKFANLILDINKEFPEHQIRILTEDASIQSPYIYRLELKYPKTLSLLSNYYRIQQYHQTALKIRRNEYPFDVIVYNNAFIGLRSTLKWKETIGMVNDYNNACRNLRDFSLDYIFLKQFVFKQLERITVRRLGTTITNSEFLKNFLSRSYDLSPGKIKVLYKGIELPEQVNTQIIDPSKPIKILFVKADYILGGLSTLISAISKLSFDFELTVIGPKSEHKDHIEGLIKEVKNISLFFKGYQPQPKVFSALLESHLYIVPSSREALGVSNLEALSLGVPVISTNVGGIPEVLKNGECGWMVKPADEMHLAAAVKECINNVELRNQKIQQGLLHVKNFRKEVVLRNFVQILCESYNSKTE